ncbi:MAG: hypothetical protein KatS3mg114_0854 [Planctomycetaceae bacterium]|jgi:hypothetical protein|nr:MAG: hypothetical protein KatS3mg114_0854 [Planctomycetaceae bacterium]
MNQLLKAPKSPATDGDMTGFLTPDEPGLCDEPAPIQRPLSLAWVSDELIAETQRLWSERYGREVSADEAIEILQNIKRFAEMLLERSET